MKQINNWIKAAAIIALMLPFNNSFAGNPQRAGQAGASELLINPWARTSGWGGANIAGVRGLEGIFSNVAGLAFTKKTELIFSQSQWLKFGDDAVADISSFGFSQKVGESGVLGFSVMSMSFGEIEITTVDLPDGGIGFYSPKFMNIGVSYAKIFSNSIYGGMTIKMISEQISNVGANGIALDAGIQYVTGEKDSDGLLTMDKILELTKTHKYIYILLVNKNKKIFKLLVENPEKVVAIKTVNWSPIKCYGKQVKIEEIDQNCYNHLIYEKQNNYLSWCCWSWNSLCAFCRSSWYKWYSTANRTKRCNG